MSNSSKHTTILSDSDAASNLLNEYSEKYATSDAPSYFPVYIFLMLSKVVNSSLYTTKLLATSELGLLTRRI